MIKTFFYCSYTQSPCGFNLVSSDANNISSNNYSCFDDNDVMNEYGSFVDKAMCQSLVDFVCGAIPGTKYSLVLQKNMNYIQGGNEVGAKRYNNIAFVFDNQKEFSSVLSFFIKSDFNELSKALAGFIVPDRSVKGSGIHIDGELFQSFLSEALSVDSNSAYNSELRFERKLLPTTTDKDYSTEICQSMGFESGHVFKDNKTTYLYSDTVKSEPVSKCRSVQRIHQLQPTTKIRHQANGTFGRNWKAISIALGVIALILLLVLLGFALLNRR